MVRAASCARAYGAAIPGRARGHRPPSSAGADARCCAGSRPSVRARAACTEPSSWAATRTAAHRFRSGSTSATQPGAWLTPAGIAHRGSAPRCHTALSSRMRRCWPGSGLPARSRVQPWFGRDALRTAASWAGMADAATEAALDDLAGAPRPGPLEALAAARIETASRTISVWMQAAGRAMDGIDPELPQVALHARAAISTACATLLDEAARACGSRPFVRAGELDRRAATSRSSSCSTGSTPCWLAPARPSWSVGAREMPMTAAEFEARYRADPDPWGYASSPYEREKYAGTLAACGPGPFAGALELGGIDRGVQRPAGSALPIAGHDRRCPHRGRRGPSPPGRSRATSSSSWARSRGTFPRALRPGGGFGDPLLPVGLRSRPNVVDASNGRLVSGGRLVAVHWRPAGAERPFTAAEVHAHPGARALAARWSTAGRTDDYLLDVLEHR